MDQEEFLNGHQIYFSQFWSYREEGYINLYLLRETNATMWSKLLMGIILGFMKIHHVSERVPEWGPELFLSDFVLQRSVIYQFVCTLGDKSNSVIKVTCGHHPWNQEDRPCIRKGSWMMTRSNFEVKRSLIYLFVCNLQDKFIGVVKTTYGHPPRSKEDHR